MYIYIYISKQKSTPYLTNIVKILSHARKSVNISQRIRIACAGSATEEHINYVYAIANTLSHTERHALFYINQASSAKAGSV